MTFIAKANRSEWIDIDVDDVVIALHTLAELAEHPKRVLKATLRLIYLETGLWHDRNLY